MDITDHPNLGALRALDARRDATVRFPNEPIYNDSLVPLLKELKQKNMYKNLEKFTSFHTRYYKSTYVKLSERLLLGSCATLFLNHVSRVSYSLTFLLNPLQYQGSGTDSKILKLWCGVLRLAVQQSQPDDIRLWGRKIRHSC